MKECYWLVLPKNTINRSQYKKTSLKAFKNIGVEYPLHGSRTTPEILTF